ncbi:hypothetical protein GCM10009678_85520 [Actinomadura kijaniata]|uniref:Uncharacterized protein n=1 Tax=Actinomadura namibiensis TaxID=182080 RepID=A0A7W3LSM0_ACTNM|nr:MULTISPECIES: hypothetical protein [Actinomadura]MBA8953499.1 hypothetical protein [Actinomadura namibiensis]
MTEQPGDVLDEAAKLFDVLRRRLTGGSGTGGAGTGADDVWSRAVTEDPHIATGAPECRNCPICRAIAMARESGPDVGRHVRQAGAALAAAALDVVAAYERTREPGRRPGATSQARPEDGRPGPAAGGDPIDIG